MVSSFSSDRAMVKGHQRIDTKQSYAEHDQGPYTFAYCLFLVGGSKMEIIFNPVSALTERNHGWKGILSQSALTDSSLR